MWFMPRFSGQDVCSGLWESAEHGTLIVSSVYCDGTVDALPELFLEVLDYCKDKGISHLTLMDSNAHHPSLWGSKKATYERARLLLDVMDRYGVELLNHGKEMTYLSQCGASEAIDLSLASNGLANSIKNWRVVDKTSNSDHRLISMDLDGEPERTLRKRPMSKVDWGKYSQRVKELCAEWHIPDTLTINELDEAGNRAVELLNDAVNEQVDYEEVVIKPAWKRWWTQELTELQDKMDKARKRALRRPSRTSWDDYRTKRKLFNKVRSKTKRDSWKKLCLDTDSINEMARLSKIMQGLSLIHI